MGGKAVGAVALACVLGLTACGQGTPIFPTTSALDGRQHPTTGASWTVLVYMVADNPREARGLDSLRELADVGSGPGLNIVAQVDRAKGYSDVPLANLADWTTTKRLLVQPGAFQELADLGELDMGDAATLSDFIAWGVRAYPADRYALVMWDPGGAWTAFGVDEEAPGADGGRDALDLTELQAGLDSGRRESGLEQFALIGFDAGLMATYEVAKLLSPHGEYLLASEEVEPGHGWDYGALAVLRQDPSSGPVVLGQRLLEGYARRALQGQTQDAFTLSLTDLYALADLTRAVGRFAALMAEPNPTVATMIAEARSSALEFGQSTDPTQAFHLVDLGSLSARLAEQTPHQSSRDVAMKEALGKAVVTQTNGARTSASTGLAIYFPPSLALYDAGYDALPEMTEWQRFLRRFLTIQEHMGAEEDASRG
ncbi:clostripain-related cysteine peptidase [Corallococcus sp. bb12-1]|uniref:clostripain-related cysteine peptidase n=1 Tax=Corallococcus sp. bb12-1 TaxID=2996784 RepID=UPI0022718827|nr:clostripain-related cysteine peptidase [Corallococcus sp. bb12-1]MCY1041175.1 clostripain-related cysteine peptidase [Corallococcus sp. bb12-1]